MLRKINTIGLFAVILIFCQCRKSNFNHYTKVPESGIKTFLRYSPEWQPMVSVHRAGGFEAGYPENCIESVKHFVSDHPAIIECDVRMSKDSVLLLMHDRSLDRTTNGSGRVEDKLWAELRNLQLEDHKGDLTDFSIPTLEELLNWAREKAILTLDVKQGVPFDLVIKAVKATATEDYAVIIAYDADAARVIHQLAPDLMISASMRNETEVDRMIETGIPYENLVAFTGTVLSDQSLFERIHKMGILCILGTLGNLDKQASSKGDQMYRTWVDHGADILATDRPRAAARAIK